MASAASSAWSASQQCSADQRERVEQRDRAMGPAENVGVHRDVEAGAWTVQPWPPFDDARQRADERGSVAPVARVWGNQFVSVFITPITKKLSQLSPRRSVYC
jgi:hypothetical protein